MAQKIVWGCVNKNGSIYSGSGFTPVQGGRGIYDIVFQTPFQTTPSIVATQNYRNWTEWTWEEGNTRDNCVLIAADRTKFKMATGSGSGDKEDRNFCFIAIGEV